jgi:hypothetical protein
MAGLPIEKSVALLGARRESCDTCGTSWCKMWVSERQQGGIGKIIQERLAGYTLAQTPDEVIGFGLAQIGVAESHPANALFRAQGM